MFKREKKVHLELNSSELRIIRRSFINWRNKLRADGKHTDPIDELLIKLLA